MHYIIKQSIKTSIQHSWRASLAYYIRSGLCKLSQQADLARGELIVVRMVGGDSTSIGAYYVCTEMRK